MKFQNIRQWKTTTVGLISFITALAYLFIAPNTEVWIFIILIAFSTAMLFLPDTFLNSFTNFLKNNDDKRL